MLRRERKSDEGRGFLSKENCVLCEPAENAGYREKRGAVWSEKGGVDSGVFESVSSIKEYERGLTMLYR